jgi:hypothetical protein
MHEAGLRENASLLEVADERLREKEFGLFHQLTKPASRRSSRMRPSFATTSASSTIARREERAGAT